MGGDKPMCDNIREDAYECMQNAQWVISPNEDPHTHIYACHDHLWRLLPRDDTAHVGYIGK